MTTYYQTQISYLQAQISELVTTMSKLDAEGLARIAAVRALHTADRDQYCTHCRGRKWPCPTFKATDGITT